jgi:hypothetical protein
MKMQLLSIINVDLGLAVLPSLMTKNFYFLGWVSLGTLRPPLTKIKHLSIEFAAPAQKWMGFGIEHILVQ